MERVKEALPWLLFTYLGAPLALLALCWPKLGARGKDEPPEEALELAVVCLALGPIAVATLTLFLFTAAPGSSYAFYRWTPVACFALLALFAAACFACRASRRFFSSFRRCNAVSLLLCRPPPGPPRPRRPTTGRGRAQPQQRARQSG